MTPRKSPRPRRRPLVKRAASRRFESESGASRPTIVDMMARTAFVDDWAQRMEQAVEDGRRKRLPWSGGDDLMDVAPRATSAKAKTWANKLAKEIERDNGATLPALYRRGAMAKGKHYREPSARDFGYSLAMMALGHGVSWHDNHPDIGLEVPHREFY